MSRKAGYYWIREDWPEARAPADPWIVAEWEPPTEQDRANGYKGEGLWLVPGLDVTLEADEPAEIDERRIVRVVEGSQR